MLVLFVSFSGTTSAFADSESHDITLYLPINSSQFPDLEKQLRVALDAASLQHLAIETADYWHSYQNSLRQGRKGIYLLAPHFAAWTLHKHNFTPLLRLPQALKYVIVAREGDSHFFEISDLAKSTICTQRAVNLDYILLNQVFNDSVLSAEPLAVWSATTEMQAQQSDCDAFAVSNHLFEKIDLAQPNHFTRLAQGGEFNNYAFVAHPKAQASTRKQLKKFLLSKSGQALLAPLYTQYSSKIGLINAAKEDYPSSYTEPLKTYWATN